MSTGEIKDIQYRNLAAQAEELGHQFHEAMDKLNGLVNDFSEGSQQRWMIAMREANALRDQIWLVEGEMHKMMTGG